MRRPLWRRSDAPAPMQVSGPLRRLWTVDHLKCAATLTRTFRSELASRSRDTSISTGARTAVGGVPAERFCADPSIDRTPFDHLAQRACPTCHGVLPASIDGVENVYCGDC